MFGTHKLVDSCPNRYLKPYYTDIQIALGIGYGARLGFNPGELVDLLLGCIGIDIYKDDYEHQKGIPRDILGNSLEDLGYSPEEIMERQMPPKAE